MGKIGQWFSVLSVVVVLGGCIGYANPVMREQTGGELNLVGDLDNAMEDAQASMTAHCGSLGHTIVREGEVVVGQRVQQQTSESAHRNNSSSQTVVQTSDVTEFHIWYTCGGTPGAPVVVEVERAPTAPTATAPVTATATAQ